MKTRVIQEDPDPHGARVTGDAADAQQPAPTNSPEGNPAVGADENPGDVPVADIPDALEPDSNGGL
jgi:hypothetical protein